MSQSSRNTQLCISANWRWQQILGCAILDAPPEIRRKEPSICISNLNTTCQIWPITYTHPPIVHIGVLLYRIILFGVMLWAMQSCMSCPSRENFGWSKRLTPHNWHYGSGSIPLVRELLWQWVYCTTHDTNTVIWPYTTRWWTRKGFLQINYDHRAHGWENP